MMRLGRGQGQKAGCQELKLHFIPIPLQQGLEAGMVAMARRPKRPPQLGR